MTQITRTQRPASYDLWLLGSSAVNSDARNYETLSDVNRRSAPIGSAVWLCLVCRLWSNQWRSCAYARKHRLCSLYAAPIVRRTTRGRFCWLNWFVWFSMHCLSTGVRHRLMRISNTVSWLMFRCHGGWLRQHDAQLWQAGGGVTPVHSLVRNVGLWLTKRIICWKL